MPRDVKTLERLAVKSVHKYIWTIGEKFIDLDRVMSKDIFEPYMESYLKSTNQLFRLAVPWNLYGEVVVKVIRAIRYLLVGRNEREQEIIWRLSQVVMNAKLKRLNAKVMPLSLWPIIWKNFNSMTGLEEIEFGYTYEVAITDDFICNLRKCPTLRKIRVRSSVKGYAKLLLGLPYLEYLPTGNMGEVLELIHKSGEFKEPFRLKAINLRFWTTEQLGLLNEMCPIISKLVIRSTEMDLCVVKILDRLTDVTLVDFKFIEHWVEKFLELHGSKIIRLSLLAAKSINLMHIDRLCPNLEALHLDEVGLEDTFESSTVQCIPPFKHLKNLHFVNSTGMDKHVKFILSGCFNIECLRIWSCAANEKTMMQALAINPMNKLTFLMISPSMKRFIKILRDRNSNLQVVEYDNWKSCLDWLR